MFFEINKMFKRFFIAFFVSYLMADGIISSLFAEDREMILDSQKLLSIKCSNPIVGFTKRAFDSVQTTVVRFLTSSKHNKIFPDDKKYFLIESIEEDTSNSMSDKSLSEIEIIQRFDVYINEMDHVGVCNLLKKYEEVLKENVQDNPIFVYTDEKRKFSLLEFAAECDNYELAKILIKLGIDVNEDCADMTPLVAACVYRNFKFVKLLLENGAKVNQKCNEGTTPFLVATSNNDEEIAVLLAYFGADIYNIADLASRKTRKAVLFASLEHDKKTRISTK